MPPIPAFMWMWGWGFPAGKAGVTPTAPGVGGTAVHSSPSFTIRATRSATRRLVS